MKMPRNEALLSEFDHEMANTRKTLERIPDQKLSYQPHPKSGSMGWLASHLANIPVWTVRALLQESFDFSPAGATPQRTVVLNSTEEVLALFDKNVADARKALAAAREEALLEPWSLLSGGHTVFTMPRGGVIRSMVMNHSIHHRGQLTMYMRLNDIPVPGLYGPSADEK
jgi:uncharacterized damage-inducible protein DinB